MADRKLAMKKDQIHIFIQSNLQTDRNSVATNSEQPRVKLTVTMSHRNTSNLCTQMNLPSTEHVTSQPYVKNHTTGLPLKTLFYHVTSQAATALKIFLKKTLKRSCSHYCSPNQLLRSRQLQFW